MCKEISCLEEFLIPKNAFTYVSSGIVEIDQIYVLNLDVRYYRWLRTQELLGAFGVYAQRVRGINGWTIPRYKLKSFYKHYVEKELHNGMTPGQIGCLLSHLSILHHALENNYRCIWVLEDDVVVLENLKNLGKLIDELDQVDPEWDVLFTDVHARGHSLDESLFFEQFMETSFDYSQVKSSFFVPYEDEKFLKIEYRLCTHSMIVSHRGIKKLLDYFQRIKISFPIDVQMHCCPGKRFYVSKKEYVTNGTRETSDTTYRPH